MGIGYVFRLRPVQPKIFNSIITWVFVNVMNDLFRRKIATDMLFHYIPMLKDVFIPRRLHIARIRMIIGSHNQNIPIFTNLASALPFRRLLFSFAVHRVIYTGSTLAVHWILIAANITMKRWIRASKVSGGSSTSLRTVSTRTTRKLPNRLSAMEAMGHCRRYLSSVGASLSAVSRIDRWVCLKGFSTYKAGSGQHRISFYSA